MLRRLHTLPPLALYTRRPAPPHDLRCMQLRDSHWSELSIPAGVLNKMVFFVVPVRLLLHWNWNWNCSKSRKADGNIGVISTVYIHQIHQCVEDQVKLPHCFPLASNRLRDVER